MWISQGVFWREGHAALPFLKISLKALCSFPKFQSVWGCYPVSPLCRLPPMLLGLLASKKSYILYSTHPLNYIHSTEQLISNSHQQDRSSSSSMGQVLSSFRGLTEQTVYRGQVPKNRVLEKEKNLDQSWKGAGGRCFWEAGPREGMHLHPGL